MARHFDPAPEVEAVGRELIHRHHHHLIDNDVRIEFFLMDPAPKRSGKEVLGLCKKITGEGSFLFHLDADASPADRQTAGVEQDEFFAIFIAREAWERLNADQRKALVDHELEHAQSEKDPETGAVKLSIRGHDIEEFSSVVRRHGIWITDLKRFYEACKEGEQISLFDAPMEIQLNGQPPIPTSMRELQQVANNMRPVREWERVHAMESPDA